MGDSSSQNAQTVLPGEHSIRKMEKTVCAFGEEIGERTKNKHFAHNYLEESDNTTQTLYSATQTMLLGSWRCAAFLLSQSRIFPYCSAKCLLNVTGTLN